MSLLNKMFPKIPTHKIKGGYILVLFGVMIIVAVIVNTYQSVQDAFFDSVVPEIQGSVRFSNPAEAESFIHTSLPAFPDIQDAKFSEAVVYTEGLEKYPVGTVITTFQINDKRLFEVLQLPENSVTIPTIPEGSQTNTVKLTEEIEGTFAKPLKEKIICHTVKQPVFEACTLTSRLMFQKDNQWYSIATDGNRASEGELLEYARKIANN